MSSLRAMLCVVLAGLPLLAYAGEPRIGKFVQYDAGDYVVVTSHGASQTKRVVENLARFRATLERLLAVRAKPGTLPTTILVAGTADWQRWLEPAQYSSGYFRRGPFDYYIAMNGSQPLGEELRVVFHEYTHYFLASQFSGKYPPWFDEGIAEVMSNVRFTNDGAILQVSEQRLGVARTADWIPFERLLRIDENDPRYRNHKWGNSFYSQAWLTVYYGMVEDPDFGRRVLDYLRALSTSLPPEEAARKAFGPDLSLVDRKLRAYLLGNVQHPGSVRLGDVPAVNLRMGEPVGEFDSIALIANVVLAGSDAPDRIRPLVDWLEAHDSDKARAAILAARLAKRTGDNAAFNRAVGRAEAELTPGDSLRQRELAELKETTP